MRLRKPRRNIQTRFFIFAASDSLLCIASTAFMISKWYDKKALWSCYRENTCACFETKIFVFQKSHHLWDWYRIQWKFVDADEYADFLSVSPKGTEFFQQENGEIFGGVVGTVTLIWFQQPKLVEVCFAETTVFLLGRKLLENTCLSIDFNRKTLNLSRSCRSRT